MILGEVQDLPKGIERENRIIQTIMRQLLFALDGLHSTGIVHRDIKPQNIIFSEGNKIQSSYQSLKKMNEFDSTKVDSLLLPFETRQVLVHSRSLILEPQQICEWA